MTKKPILKSTKMVPHYHTGEKPLENSTLNSLFRKINHEHNELVTIREEIKTQSQSCVLTAVGCA